MISGKSNSNTEKRTHAGKKYNHGAKLEVRINVRCDTRVITVKNDVINEQNSWFVSSRFTLPGQD